MGMTAPYVQTAAYAELLIAVAIPTVIAEQDTEDSTVEAP